MIFDRRCVYYNTTIFIVIDLYERRGQSQSKLLCRTGSRLNVLFSAFVCIGDDESLNGFGARSEMSCGIRISAECGQVDWNRRRKQKWPIGSMSNGTHYKNFSYLTTDRMWSGFFFHSFPQKIHFQPLFIFFSLCALRAGLCVMLRSCYVHFFSTYIRPIIQPFTTNW